MAHTNSDRDVLGDENDSDMVLISRGELLSLRMTIEEERKKNGVQLQKIAALDAASEENQKTIKDNRSRITALEATSPSFIEFPRLPRELRDMIFVFSCVPRIIPLEWDETETVNTTVKLQFSRNASKFPISRRIPISAVCKESRLIFKKLYKNVSILPSDFPIYVNFSMDTLLIQDLKYQRGSLTFDTEILASINGPQGVRYLACSSSECWEFIHDQFPPRAYRHYEPFLSEILRNVPNLQELIVVEHSLPCGHEWSRNRYSESKFVAFEDPRNWEYHMSEIMEWHARAEKAGHASASIKMNLAGIRLAKNPESRILLLFYSFLDTAHGTNVKETRLW